VKLPIQVGAVVRHAAGPAEGRPVAGVVGMSHVTKKEMEGHTYKHPGPLPSQQCTPHPDNCWSFCDDGTGYECCPKGQRCVKQAAGYKCVAAAPGTKGVC
jgi:hypothetical protein